MPDQCEPGRMPIACVEKFEMGVRAMTEAADAIRTVGAKVDTVCVLLTGNGAPETGMVFRVKSLEMAAEDAGKARGKWKDRLWCLATGALLVALAWSLAGCIPSTEKTADHLVRAQASLTAARESIQAAQTETARLIGSEEAPEPVKAGLHVVAGHQTAAQGHIDDVVSHASAVQKELPNLDDKPGWFANLTGDVSDVIQVIAGTVIIVILFVVGVWLIRRFGYLLPRRAKDEAELAKAALDENSPTTARELIALRRATDPNFNAAMRKARPPPTI